MHCNEGLFVGDGFCDDESNNKACNYDGGDCCGECVVKVACSECVCLVDDTGNGFTNPLLGDSVCNDETNNVQCNYDGFDCCVNPVNTGFCSNCTCHGKSLAHCRTVSAVTVEEFLSGADENQ